MSLLFDRARALRDIDQAAGAARERYITDVAGQQAVYLTKMQEAMAYLAAHAANPATAVAGAHIARQAERTSKTPLVVAQDVVDTGGLWLGEMSPIIEAERMAGKEAVAAAVSAEDIISARDAAVSILMEL